MMSLKQVDEMQGASSWERSEYPVSSSSSSLMTVMANVDTNSNDIIGLPLQASSPFSTFAFHACEGNGDGDNHSIRSVYNSNLSPIRYTMANHQVKCATIETPPPHSSSPVTLDSFVGNFEKSSTNILPQQPCSPEQETLLTEKVSGMEETEAKKLLTKVLIDNMGLRQELRSKDKRITAYKGQMLAILDWKTRPEADEESDENNHNHTSTSAAVSVNPFLSSGGVQMTKGISCHHHRRLSSSVTTELKEEDDSASETEKNMVPHKTVHSTEEITMVEEVYGMRRSLSIIQELASSIDMDQDLIKDRLIHGCYLTNQLLMGGITGWISALFVKKFGKLALSATGGGLVLLVYTARKGFVNVNYESIYEEISRFCDNVENQYIPNDPDVDLNGIGNVELEGPLSSKGCDNMRDDDDDNQTADQLPRVCSYDKLKQAKNWLATHTYTVGGFVITFIYNLI